jgi:hypothetical protein
MIRDQYLNDLKENLSSLNPQELNDVVDYFTEYFEEQDDDAKVIAELGDPWEAAQEILKNMEREETSQADTKTSYSSDFGQETFKEEFRKEFDKETFKEAFKKDFHQNFQNHFKETFQKNFLKNFIKNFNFSVNVQESDQFVKVTSLPLEDLSRIHLDLENDNLSIKLSPLNHARLTYTIDIADKNQSLPYLFKDGKLSLYSNEKLYIRKIDLELPQDPFLLEISGNLEDVNLNIEKLTVDDLSLSSEDCNLSFTALQIKNVMLQMDNCNLSLDSSKLGQVTMNAEDCNLSILSCQLDKMELEAEDCKLTSHRNQIISSLHVQAEDSNLTHEMDRQEVSNYQISAEDSTVNLATDLVGQSQKTGDTFYFNTVQERSNTVIRFTCQDSTLTIL